MKKVLIAGGGFAGLSSAVYLSDYAEVTLLESSPKLGGRAYSFFDKELNLEIDNGQHLLLNCYDYTLNYFKKIGCLHNFEFQDKLRIPFVTRDKQLFYLDSEKYFYPFNLLNAFNQFKLFNFAEKWKIEKLLFNILFFDDISLKSTTVYDWLIEENQDIKTIKYFWEVLAIGILNSDIKKTSALTFRNVLRKVFNNKNSFKFVLPKKGLSNSYVDSSVEYLLKNNAKVYLNERVTGFEITGDKITNVQTLNRMFTKFDYVISAVPFYGYDSISNGSRIINSKIFIKSSIISAQLKTKFYLPEKYYALVDSPIQWVFIKGNHLSITISNADNLLNYSNDELYKLFLDELKIYFNISKSDIEVYKIIKEKRATFIPDPLIESLRPDNSTIFRNMFIAGDFTNTGYPSTIESAVKSGYNAAEKILSLF